ncbi:CAP domain-containing protein [Fusobacterium nucleatum]|uniref:CAP domain-containing protein n=1 Tax=Fusobacterium nucleatum TaxID=851 RepID=UPI0030D1898F
MKKFFKILIVFTFIFNTLTVYSINIKKKYSDKYMIDLHTWLPDTFEELKSFNEDELYRMAVEKYHYHQDKSNFYTQKEFKQIEKFVNVEKLNQYFVERLNKERAKLGLSSNVRIDNTLIKAAKIRSNELAVAKRISHKRPNKTEYWTVFEKVDKNLLDKYSFENILKVSISNEAQMISEKFIANYFFDSWKESPEHRKFMVDPELKKIGVNFSFGSSDDTNFLVQINYGVLLGMR